MSMNEKRKFNPDGPRKKPFYDTKRKKLVIPAPCSGNDGDSPARGGPASGLPARRDPGHPGGVCSPSLLIERKYQHLSDIPRDEEGQNTLGESLLAAVISGDCTDTGLFAISLGLNPYKFHHIADTNEYFSDCLQTARYYIGAQMIAKAQSREQDGNVNMRLLPLYNTDYRRMVEEFKASEASKAANAVITVIAQDIPSSPLVPLLRKKDV
jgi:hypothetical protein